MLFAQLFIMCNTFTKQTQFDRFHKQLRILHLGSQQIRAILLLFSHDHLIIYAGIAFK